MDVTAVTRGATRADALTDRDYREIFGELRERMSLRRFVELIGSVYSFGWWGKYEQGQVVLTRAGKQELRRAVGLPALPPSVEEALAEVDPDAAVWLVGSGRPDRVVAIGADAHEPVVLRVNGNLAVMSQACGLLTAVPAEPQGMEGVEGAVSPVTRRQRGAARSSIVIGREAWERLSAARLVAGVSWEVFLARLLEEGDA